MPDTLKAITVVLAAPSVTVGATVKADWEPTFKVADTAMDDNFPITWTTSNTAVATVDSSGLIRGVAVGTATIRATSGTIVSPAVTITVTAPVIPTIDIPTAAFQQLFNATAGSQRILREQPSSANPARTLTVSVSA